MTAAHTVRDIQADLVVVGGGVGCLVAAISAADAGRSVTLLLPERGIGAGFATMARNGFHLDMGCRRLDLTHEGEAPLETYRPGMGSRPFAPHIRRFLEDRIGLEITSTASPKMIYAGVLADDFTASLDLTPLPRMLGTEDAAAVERETAALLSATPPSALTLGLGSPPDLAAGTLEEASLANHGLTLHTRMIAPFAAKLYPDKWRSIPADLAAKIWTPLLYPRTVNAGCRGNIERGRGAVTYFYPASGYFGELIEKLLAAAEATPGLTISRIPDLTNLSRDGARTTAELADGSPLRWECPFIIGSSVEAWCALAGVKTQIEKLPLAIIWLEVNGDNLLVEPGLLHVFEPTTSAYRVSFGGTGARPGHQIVTVEMTGNSPECTTAMATDALTRLGVLRPDATVTEIACQPALTIVAPSASNRDALRTAHARLAAQGIMPRLIGTLNDLKADTLNDHILQGLTAHL
ncbi:hypothetical protein [Pyruvatibacter mobilis]|uniref:hypothetical protein n=1 Tax=Pyruvatibacter mobilis TaxID=1712261 RepID=UPI003BA8CF08